MKKVTLILLLNFLLGSLLYSQTPPDFPAPPGMDCQSAPVLCSYEDLDGYNSANPALFNSSSPPGFCAIDINNIQWLGFIAESSFLELFIEVENCQGSLNPPGGGIQAQIFGTNSCCSDFFPVSNCYNAGAPDVSFVLSGSALEAGQIYYLVIDGWAGDICNWTVNITDFDTIPPPDPADLDISINGPSFGIQGGIETYTLTFGDGQNLPGQSTGCSYNFVGNCLSGIPCWVTDLEVNWDVPPQAMVVSYPDPFSIEVVWTDFPGELCATLTADCIDTLTTCITVQDAAAPCQNARLLCGDELLLYQGITADSFSLYPTNCQGGYNANWIKFYACGDSMNFSLALDSCPNSLPGQELVMEVFEFTYCDSTLFQNSLGCINVAAGQQDTFGLGGLDPQGLYLLMISKLLDDTSACAYQLQFLDGVAGQAGEIIPISDASIDGPGEVCLGEISSYTYVPPSYDIIGGNGGATCPLPDSLCPRDSIVSTMCWSIPEGATFLSDSCGVNTIEVMWSDTLDGEISVYWIQDTIALDTMTYDSTALACCGGFSGGVNIGASMDVNVNFDIEHEDYIICEGECIDLYGDTYCEDASFAVFDSCKIISVQVDLIETELIDLGLITLCEGDCFDLEGQLYCEPGFYTQPGSGPFGCEALYLFTIELIPQDLFDLGTIVLCEGECFNLEGVDFCAPGIYSEILIGPDGCEDIYLFTLEIIPPLSLSIGPVIELCDGAGDFYQVSFDISTSDPAALVTVNGMPVSGSFISDPISSGDPYDFVIDAVDSEGCFLLTEFVSGQFDCPLLCMAEAGSMQSGHQDLCESQSAQVQNNGDEELGPDDMLEYILHTGADPLSGSVISRSVQGLFSYQAGNMEYGQPYQVSAVAGLADSTGQVDLSDPCLDIAVGGTVTFYEDPIAIAFASTDLLTCLEPEVFLQGIAEDGSGNLSVGWVGPVSSFNSILSTEVPGSYLFFAEDLLTGCIADEEILILEDKEEPEFSISGENSIDCGTPAVQLQAVSNDPLLQYLWQTPLGEQVSGATITAGADGGYLLTATGANGCTAVQSHFIEDNTNDLSPEALGGTIDCDQTSVTLSVANTQGSWTYLWTGPGGFVSTEADPEVDQPGGYLLEVTDDGGCTGQDSAFVEADFDEPNASLFSSGNLDCQTEEVQLFVSSSTPNVTVLWEGPDGFLSEQLNPWVQEPGTYLLTVTAPNGCTTTQDLQVAGDFEAPQVEVSGTELNCKNDPEQLIASSNTPGLSYLWTGPDGFTATGPYPEVSQTGIFSLLVTGQNGCTSEYETEVGQLPRVQPLSLEAETPTCFGDSDGSLRIGGITGGNPPYDALFNGFNYGDQREFAPLPAGSYPVSLIDKDGCRWDSTLAIPEADQFMIAFNNLPEIELGEEVEVELVTNQEAVSIEWRIDEEIILTDETVLVFEPESSLSLEVEATNERGCTVTEEVEIKVRKRNGIFVPNIFTPNGDGKNDFVTVYAGEGVNLVRSFQIFDRWGNLMFERSNFPANQELLGWDGRYKGKLMRPAVYVYQAVTQLADGTEKVYYGDIVLRR